MDLIKTKFDSILGLLILLNIITTSSWFCDCSHNCPWTSLLSSMLLYKKCKLWFEQKTRPLSPVGSSPPSPPPVGKIYPFNVLFTWYLRPETWHLRPETWHLRPDTWHLTPDTWHRTPDTWHMVGVEHSLKSLAPRPLRFGIDSVLNILNERMTYRIN